jgi:hypothetical protein
MKGKTSPPKLDPPPLQPTRTIRKEEETENEPD